LAESQTAAQNNKKKYKAYHEILSLQYQKLAAVWLSANGKVEIL
jgi:hypothetical protein